MDLFFKIGSRDSWRRIYQWDWEKGRKETVRVDPNRLGGSGGARA